MTRLRRGAVLLVLIAAAGCAARKNEVVFVDPGPARLIEAKRLAEQAERAQKAGRTDEAIELYRQSLEQSQDLFHVWNNLGMLLLQKDNYLDAAEAFHAAANLAPKDPRPMYNVGVVYQRRAHDRQALDFFVKALERDPRYLPALRGAVATGKSLMLTDEAALLRVRTAVMLESDPQWRRLMEMEQFRLEDAVRSRSGR